MILDWWHVETGSDKDGDLTFTFKVVPNKFDEMARSLGPLEIERLRQKALRILNTFGHLVDGDLN